MAGTPESEARPHSNVGADAPGIRLQERLAGKLSAVSRRAGEFCAELDEVHTILERETEAVFARREELDKLAEQLSRRMEELQRQSAGLVESEAALKVRVEALRAHKEALGQREGELRERDARLEHTGAELDKRAGALDKLEAELQERHAMLETVQEEIDGRQGVLDREEQRLNEREAPLAQRAQEFQRRREELAREAEDLLHREAELAARARDIERRREEFVRHRRQHGATPGGADPSKPIPEALLHQEGELEERSKAYAQQWSELEAEFHALEQRVAGVARRAGEAVAESGAGPEGPVDAGAGPVAGQSHEPGKPAPERGDDAGNDDLHLSPEQAEQLRAAARLTEGPLGDKDALDDLTREPEDDADGGKGKRRWWGR